jgi:hypothetical protein
MSNTIEKATGTFQLNENGYANLLGMNVKISDIIGDKIVDQFMATIAPDQMAEISKVLFHEVFEEVERIEYEGETVKRVKSVKFKDKDYDRWGHISETTIYTVAKATLREKYSQIIEKKVAEYINSDEYKEKAAKIAKAIIDYALEDYKNDVIKELHRKLVTGVVTPKNADEVLSQTILEEAQSVVNQHQSAFHSDSNNYY